MILNKTKKGYSFIVFFSPPCRSKVKVAIQINHQMQSTDHNSQVSLASNRRESVKHRAVI